MVEQKIIDLRSKKYCNPGHVSNIEFFCKKEDILVCEGCAANHLEHAESLESLKSLYSHKHAQYQRLNDIVKILSKSQLNADEIRSSIGQKLELAFDHLIAKIRNMKSAWIEENFKIITDDLGGIQRAPDLKEMQHEIDKAMKMIKNYVDSEGNRNTEEIFHLKLPEEFDKEIKEATKIINLRKKAQTFEIDINFERELVTKMLNIKGPYGISMYSGSLLNLTDLSFILSLFPQPIKELKMLYSAKNEGNSNTFHSNCDGKGDTLVIAKGNGHLFGGFAKPKWTSNNKPISDPSKTSFLFTCRNKTKHDLIDYKNALLGHLEFGPTFGISFSDLYIHSNLINKGHTCIGKSYSIPVGSKREDYMGGTVKCQSITYEDYEVHQVIFK